MGAPYSLNMVKHMLLARADPDLFRHCLQTMVKANCLNWDNWIGSCYEAHLDLAARISPEGTGTDRFGREYQRRENRMDRGAHNPKYRLRATLCRNESEAKPCYENRTSVNEDAAGCAFFHVHWEPDNRTAYRHPASIQWDQANCCFIYVPPEITE